MKSICTFAGRLRRRAGRGKDSDGSSRVDELQPRTEESVSRAFTQGEEMCRVYSVGVSTATSPRATKRDTSHWSSLASEKRSGKRSSCAPCAYGQRCPFSQELLFAQCRHKEVFFKFGLRKSSSLECAWEHSAPLKHFPLEWNRHIRVLKNCWV